MKRKNPEHSIEQTSEQDYLTTTAKKFKSDEETKQQCLDANAPPSALSASLKNCLLFYKTVEAKQLLKYVLEGKAENARKMYTANPKLLFMNVSVDNYQVGLNADDTTLPQKYSSVTTPFRAMAGCGDVWM